MNLSLMVWESQEYISLHKALRVYYLITLKRTIDNIRQCILFSADSRLTDVAAVQREDRQGEEDLNEASGMCERREMRPRIPRNGSIRFSVGQIG